MTKSRGNPPSDAGSGLARRCKLRIAAVICALAMIGSLSGCCTATYWELIPKVEASSIAAAGLDHSGALVMQVGFADGTQGLYRYSMIGPRTTHDLNSIDDIGTATLVPTKTIQIPLTRDEPSTAESRFSPGTSIEVTMRDRLICIESVSRPDQYESVACPNLGVDWTNGESYKDMAFIIFPVAVDIVTSPIQLIVYLCIDTTDQLAE